MKMKNDISELKKSLNDIRQIYLIDVNEDGEPKASLKEMMLVWDNANKLLSSVNDNIFNKSDELLFKAFKAGETWGVTYSTWFTPDEGDDKLQFEVFKTTIK